MNTEKNKVIFSDYSKVEKFVTNEETLIQSTKEMVDKIILKS